MRKSRYTEGQIAMALRQAESGTPVVEICRKLGVSELRELRQLREGNRKLKGLVADLSLDKIILQESLRIDF